MTEIPDDVMKAAEAAYSDAVRGGHDTRSFESRIEEIARAIMAERERCAKVVEEYELIGHPRLSPGAEINAWYSGQERAYEMARRGILKLPRPPK